MTTAELLASLKEIAKGDGYALHQATEELEKRLRMESAKSVGAAGIVKILERMMRDPSRPAIAGAWIDSEGYQSCTDGYRAFRFRNQLSLPMLDTSRYTPVNLEKIFQPVETSPDYYTVSLADFDLAEIRAGIKLAKAEKKSPVLKIGDVAFNANYFAEMMQVMPDAVLYLHRDHWYKPAQGVSESGQCLLLPMRLQGNWEWTAKIVYSHPGNAAEKVA